MLRAMFGRAELRGGRGGCRLSERQPCQCAEQNDYYAPAMGGGEHEEGGLFCSRRKGAAGVKQDHRIKLHHRRPSRSAKTTWSSSHAI